VAEPRIGVIGIPGKWSTEILADAVEKRTGFRLVIDLAEVELDLADHRLWFEQQDLCSLDGLIIKKISETYSANTLDRLELLRVAEHAGVRVFSRVENILRLVNRLSCTVTLRNAGIPMPATRVSEDPRKVECAVDDFGRVVLKPLFSTKARGMEVVDATMTTEERAGLIRAFHKAHPMMYVQQMIDIPGRDLGLVFLGGEYLGSYARVAGDAAWNTTINSGGRYADHRPSQDIIDLAQRAQAPFALDFTTVDVVESADGPVVFEVSAFGGFRGALEGAGIDAASRYADYACARVRQR
jgi:tetrahydromethanopterin:alpha-L-glutamate ligase